jgi:hypothetical protein
MTDEVNYSAIAASIWTGVNSIPGGKMALPMLDTILAEHGLKPASRGSVRRDTWNYQRFNHRQRFNRVLQQTHRVTLEVYQKNGPNGWSIYHLVPVTQKMFADPFKRIEQFLKRTRKHFLAIKHAYDEAHPMPEGLDQEGLNRWRELSMRRFERLILMLFDEAERTAIETGFRKYLPEFSAEIVNLRERMDGPPQPKRSGGRR